MRRMLFAVTASVLLAGCQSSTAPSRTPTPSGSARDGIEPPAGSVPNPNCRSGWSVPDGRCV
jgi:hypothetical protein